MRLRLAALQFGPARGEVAANLAEVEAGLRAARERDLAWVGLPEMWPTSFAEGLDVEAAWEITRPALERVRELSEELDLVVFGSAFGRGAAGEDKPRNRLTVFDAGRVALEYDKVHLFSPTGEREGFAPGTEPPRTVVVRGVRVSGAVCYDLRFAPLWRGAWLDEAELLLVPAQWPAPRAAHWCALVLGRAAEHQAALVAVNRTGVERIGRRGRELAFSGNSILAGPDGTVRALGRGEDGLVAAEVDLEEIRALRRAVPVRRDERPDSYIR